MNFFKRLLLTLPALALTAQGTAPSASAGNAETTAPDAPVRDTDGRRFAAYFTAWSNRDGAPIDLVDATLLTHINYSFAHLRKNGTVFLPHGRWDARLLRRLTALRAANPQLKIIISVGGWTDSEHFSAVAANPAARRRFADTTLALFDRFDLDGIDIDWEYPVTGGNNIDHRPEDSDNFVLLLSELRKAFDDHGAPTGRRYELSVAAGAIDSYIETVALSEIARWLDYINIMTYDYHTSLTPYTGHNAPLYPHKEGDSSVSGSVAKFIAAGVPSRSINLGMPFYGRAWKDLADTTGDIIGQPATPVEGKYITFTDVERMFPADKGFKRCVDEVSHAPYLFDGTTFVSCDTCQSIAEKIDYAIANDLGGMMFWEFAGDREMTLQRLVSERFLRR